MARFIRCGLCVSSGVPVRTVLRRKRTCGVPKIMNEESLDKELSFKHDFRQTFLGLW